MKFLYGSSRPTGWSPVDSMTHKVRVTVLCWALFTLQTHPPVRRGARESWTPRLPQLGARPLGLASGSRGQEAGGWETETGVFLSGCVLAAWWLPSPQCLSAVGHHSRSPDKDAFPCPSRSRGSNGFPAGAGSGGRGGFTMSSWLPMILPIPSMIPLFCYLFFRLHV